MFSGELKNWDKKLGTDLSVHAVRGWQARFYYYYTVSGYNYCSTLLLLQLMTNLGEEMYDVLQDEVVVRG